MSQVSMRSRCKTVATTLAVSWLLLGGAGDAAGAGFRPWDPPGHMPSPWLADRGDCHRDRLGGAVGGLIGGVIGSRIGRHSDNRNARVATTAFGSLFGYLIGSQIGRSMDQADADCLHDPPAGRGAPPPSPGGTTAIQI